MRAFAVCSAGIAALLASQISGCSFALTEGPPSVPVREAELECTTSRTAPILDSVVAGGLLVLGAGYIIYGVQKSTPETSRGTFVGAGIGALGFSGVFTWSALVGFRRVRGCRRAHVAAKDYSPIETESGKPLGHAAEKPIETDIDK